MNERVEKMRQLLRELEAEMSMGNRAETADATSSELAIIIQQIVDDLQPLLTPYDAAFYWFLFRHSIAKDGQPFLRVSTRHLSRAVVRSSYSQAEENTISLGKVQETIRALEDIGAIHKEGEPNREGTLYRVMLPNEIDACLQFRAERDSSEPELLFPSSGIKVN
jgi:hypothetical protein